jgi:hypothetical protein
MCEEKLQLRVDGLHFLCYEYHIFFYSRGSFHLKYEESLNLWKNEIF